MREGSIDGFRSGRIGVAFAVLAMLSLIPVHNVAASVDEGLFDGVHVLLAPYAATPKITQDGTISAGEYDKNDSWTTPDTHLAVMLKHDNGSLYVAVSGPAWGWLALGISSDMEVGMGFILMGSVGGHYIAEERFVSNVSGSLVFSAVHPSSEKTIDKFASAQQGSDVTAELKLSMESPIWNLSAGTVFATVIASNSTVGYSLPASVSGDQIQYLGSYLLRPQDDLQTIKTMFSGEVSSVPGYVALVLMALGTVAIVYEYMLRRGRR